MQTLMNEFIAIKIVSRFPSFESNSRSLRNNQLKMATELIASAKRYLNIWNLSLLTADPERCIETCKEQNLLSLSVKSASGNGFVTRCSRTTAMDNF